MMRRLRLAAATLPALFVLAACGEDELPATTADAGTSADATTGNPDASSADGTVAADATPGADATGPAVFVITTETLPGGGAGMPYTATIQAANGTEPYHFSLGAGAGLPSGLSLSDDGTISGTPASAGVARLTVEAADSASPANHASKDFQLKILPATGSPLEIITVSLPDGMVGAAYTTALMAAGGATPYVWSLASGTLPAGLALSPDGTLSGTPTGAGSASFAVQVTDATAPQQIATANLSISVAPATGNALEIVTASLPSGTVGTVYTATLAAAGGVTPYNWSLANGTSLPSGLVLDSSGAISGTPSQAGSTTFTVQVVDTSNPTQLATAQLSISIAPSGTGTPLSITTNSLPDATLNEAYTATVTSAGGTPPVAFSISSGALPPGVSIASTGEITGVPAQAGTFTFTVQATDSGSPQQVATRSLAITVNGGVGTPLSITTQALADGTVNTAYAATFAALGGTTPYQWALEAGSSLPAGLVLLSTGEIQGTPTAAGQTSFTVVVVDSSNPQQTASAAFTITIAPPVGQTLVITTNALPSATTGVLYDQTLGATGGTAPYSWTLVSGSLPGGITLDAGGVLTGTATIAGTYNFTVEVADASNPAQTAQASFTLTVNAPATGLVITTGALPRARVGATYAANLAAMGGTTPYVWSITGGSLPLALVLSSTGAITGTASTAGSYTFVVQVTDASNPQLTAQKQLTITTFATPGTGVAILNQSLHDGVVGRQYSGIIAVAGGVRPYAWSVSGGTFPPGLVLGATDGRISGVPTSSGAFSFTVRVTDASTPVLSATRVYTLRIAEARRAGALLRITTRNLPGAMINLTYTATLAAAGGQIPYVWSIAQGTLPQGLTLSPGGAISGTPTQRGNSSFTVQVTDSAAMPASATRQLNLNVH